MDIDAIQAAVKAGSIYADDYGIPIVPYLALGMAGEAGEVANKVKKLFRGRRGKDSHPTKAELRAIILELGDTLWYWLRLCDVLGLKASQVAKANIRKTQRKRKGRKS